MPRWQVLRQWEVYGLRTPLLQHVSARQVQQSRMELLLSDNIKIQNAVQITIRSDQGEQGLAPPKYKIVSKSL